MYCKRTGETRIVGNGPLVLIAARRARFCELLLSLALATSCLGQVVVPGADGSDGAFNPMSNTVVDLRFADTAAWDGPNPNPGEGVYDVDKWAIVFRYSSVNIPAGVTVSFVNHPSGAPVVWLVDGPVTVNGVVSLDSHNVTLDALGYTIPGPGGFRGAGSNRLSGGLGPGGGNWQAGVPTLVGNSRLLPLIGGSGRAGVPGSSIFSRAGGGAILLAATGTIVVNGTIQANTSLAGTGWSASGGGVRIIGDRLEGGGQLQAVGDPRGRIRVEVNSMAFAPVGDPVISFGLPGETAEIWPDSATAPSVRIVSIANQAPPVDPRASFEFPYADLNLTSGQALTIVFETRNVPTGTDPEGTPAWLVVARVTPRSSPNFTTANATFVSGNFAQATWEATLTLPNGFSAIQARASMPPQP